MIQPIKAQSRWISTNESKAYGGKSQLLGEGTKPSHGVNPGPVYFSPLKIWNIFSFIGNIFNLIWNIFNIMWNIFNIMWNYSTLCEMFQHKVKHFNMKWNISTQCETFQYFMKYYIVSIRGEISAQYLTTTVNIIATWSTELRPKWSSD